MQMSMVATLMAAEALNATDPCGVSLSMTALTPQGLRCPGSAIPKPPTHALADPPWYRWQTGQLLNGALQPTHLSGDHRLRVTESVLPANVGASMLLGHGHCQGSHIPTP